MSEAIHYDRRRFIGTAVTAMAGAGLVASRLGELEPWNFVETKSSTTGSLGPLKQVDAGGLKVRYTEAGPSNGPPAILLHGSPYGSNSNIDVAPLATSGYRVIMTAAPTDVMALMAALKIEKALIGGFDDGARTAEVMAALWPQRCKGIVPVSGSVVVTLAANQRPLPPKEELEWWYRYYFLRDGFA
jgi:pimeloyl-ACP methyl ester carboxylesterase